MYNLYENNRHRSIYLKKKLAMYLKNVKHLLKKIFLDMYEKCTMRNKNVDMC